MKIQFDQLEYQDKAINAAVNLFEGQQVKQSNFTVVDKDIQGKLWTDYGIGNKVDVSERKILENLQDIQISNDIVRSDTLSTHPPQFNIEMETGTGKTFVYIKTMLELNKNYGFSKFIIVVPSIAIKEGVMKTFEMTKEYFKREYNGVVYRPFIYDSKKLDEVRTFAVDNTIQIMIINIQAFIKDVKDEEERSSKAANIIYRESDHLSGMAPIDLIAATKPIVIIDEPQSVDNTPKSQEAIRKLNPSFTLRYSATHKSKYPLLYKLGPVEAYENKLVKQIEVAGVQTRNDVNSDYMKLISTANKRGTFSARIEMNVRGRNKIERKVVTVKQGDDLFVKSKNLDAYSNGYIINDISVKPGHEYVDFTSNDRILTIDDEVGNEADMLLKRQQIRKTIEEHLNKELKLNPSGIKVLSLFFIDKVENYRQYNEAGEAEKGIYAHMFEEEYQSLIRKPKYRNLRDQGVPVGEVHDGYFSVDKKGRVKDTRGDTQADDSTYETIMKDKEELLTFYDSAKESAASNNKARKMRFIFSHSALKEGWDNPNVFQICTLIETKDTITKRQKIGRGLRLAVNQEGERQYGFDINTLTVMANESYEEFAKGLQEEFEEEGVKFGYFDKDSFATVSRIVDEVLGTKEIIEKQKAHLLFEEFVAYGYIDKKGKGTEKLKKDLDENRIILSEEFEPFRDSILSKIDSKTKTITIKDKDKAQMVTFQKEVLLNEDFRTLWDSIKYKTRYDVEFDSEALIEEASRQMQDKLAVSKLRMEYSKANVSLTESGLMVEEMKHSTLSNIEVDYAAPDIISYLQNETQLTRRTIIRILKESETLSQFKHNPQEYMMKAAKIINSTKRSLLVDGIKYHKIGENEYYSQELFESEEITGYIENNAIRTSSEKTPYDYVVYDSNIERKFAEDCEKDDNVRFYIKLPSWFKINTPLGNYNPDWAVCLSDNEEEKLYFVAETKGSILNEELRPREEAKIRCGKEHFHAIATGASLEAVESLDQLYSRVL